MPWLELRNVVKEFRGHVAVDGISLSVEKGEMVALVGPSGCGKTTTLRMIAGFEDPTSGEIWIGGRDVTRLMPHKRNIGFTFQNYALFPHMTVEQNVAFGLRMRNLPPNAVKEKVAAALAMVRLTGLERRYPRELSGGQQQRVALARAIVIEPVMLLLDEPLSNLDAKLREEMRVEIKQIQRRLNITTIFVTHDQEEALAIADRVVVMNRGRIVQVGVPSEVYERPANSFVAGFVGSPNLMPGEALGSEGKFEAVKTQTGLKLLGRAYEPLLPGTPVMSVVRKTRVNVSPADAVGDGRPNSFAGRVDMITYLGDYVQYVCSVGHQQIIATVPLRDSLHRPFGVGTPVHISWRPEDCLVIPDDPRSTS